MKTVEISRKKKFDHVIGEETKVVYEIEFEERSAKEHIEELIAIWENQNEDGEFTMPLEIDDLRNLKLGFYEVPDGDFTCYIEIK